MQPVFIVGCPRPGTTLLQALLASHPDVHSLPETHFLQSLLRCEDQRRYARATPAQWWRSVRAWRRGAMAAAGWAGPRRVRRSWAGMPELAACNTVAEAFSRAGDTLGDVIADRAWETAAEVLRGADIALEIVIFDREGRLVGHAPRNLRR